jgi:tetratricopeptide (TPR) repeat protein
VFDVGEADDEVFFSMEYVHGEDLSALLRRAGRLTQGKVIDIARQLCGGLSAAHARGVLHRDLKPANILIDEDGQVRITDFGIAVTTRTGGQHGLAGTPMYMAPEQHVAGAALSPQTDLYALGLVLYELVTGEHPARRAAAAPLAPPSTLVPDIDPALESTIMRALSVNPGERPASAAAMAATLPSQITSSPGVRARESRPAYLRPWPIALASLIAALAAVSALLTPRGAPALTEQDTIVLSDITNTTDEPLFSGALKVALAVALEQSPFLRVFPDNRVQETLRLMERPPDTRLTKDVAREIAVREQLKATISGSIASLGRNYVLALEATNAQTGDVIAREQVEATSKEEVLTALGTAATSMREKLGESLASIRAFDAPLPRATTPSLEALNAYALAMEEGRVSIRVQSIPHVQRALELDPNFALAHALMSAIYANTGQSALAPAYSRRAYELRDRVSERERYFISWRYFRDALEDWNQGIELARAWTAAYPREAFAFNSLGLSALTLGDMERAIDPFREAIRLDPRFFAPPGNLSEVYRALGRFDDARAVVRRALDDGLDFISIHREAYLLAYLDGDTQEMDQQLALARRTEEAVGAEDWPARIMATAGRFSAASEEFQRAVLTAQAQNFNEWAARFLVGEGEAASLVGRCADTRRVVDAAIMQSRDSGTLDLASRLLAWCGDAAGSTALNAEIVRRFPDAVLRVHASVPIASAALAIRQGDAARGLQILAAVEPYDRSSAARLWPNYLRGEAYLMQKDAARAAEAFQWVIDHRGRIPDSMLYPLSLLGRARAAAAASDTAEARTCYEMLFDLWRDADADLRPLQEARLEYARLR